MSAADVVTPHACAAGASRNENEWRRRGVYRGGVLVHCQANGGAVGQTGCVGKETDEAALAPAFGMMRVERVGKETDAAFGVVPVVMSRG